MKRTLSFAMLALFCVSVADAAQSFIPGKLKEEYWQGNGTGPFKAAVEAGTAGLPTSVSLLASFEVPLNIANNYSVRVSGVFIPAATGDYVFILSADDTADLFLSTDATPANKRVIAQQPGWNSSRQWVSDAGGGLDLQQKTSNTWTNGVGDTPFATGIHLLAGTQYYIEGVMNEFGGGDNLAVTFYNQTTESPPTDLDAPRLTGSVIGVNVVNATTLTFTSQPQNTTVFAGTVAQFAVAVQTDSEIAPSYQWRKGGVNITNATAAAYSLIAGSADNAAQFDCVVTVPGLTNTSSAATLTVQSGAITVNGRLKNEFFSGKDRVTVENGGGGIPTFVSEFRSFEAPVDSADNFTRRVSGYFIPAASGNYVFFVCSDDDSDLFLSIDDNPVNKRLIAQEQNWSGNLSWVSSGGGSSLSQKRSDQWSPDGGTTAPYSAGIPLVAGTKYYIEGVAHEGGGGDDFSATFKLLADPDPADGTAPLLTNAVIAYLTRPVTTGTITNQPQNVTAYESSAVSMSVGVQTDSELRPLYQWRKGGVNILANANAATYTIPYAVVSDSGSYDCVMTIPNFAGTLTSSAATVTVQTAPFITGYLKYEYFPNSSRTAVEANTAGNPSFAGTTVGSDKSGATTIFESGVNFADNYANRFSGFFVPPATADYVFFVSSDDDSDLFLSTDDKPANKRMIAQEVSWSNSRAWNTPGGGTSTAAQKRSDQFSPDGGTTFPFATGIHLVAGQRYYIEGVHAEGGGGDDFGATYIVYGAVDPADGDAPALTGSVVGVLVPPQAITITQQPQSVTVPAPNTATFTVAATTTGFYPAGYQWQKGGVDIAGATSASYTTPITSIADNNSQYRCFVSILGTSPTNSATATLTVTVDVVPPTLVSARRSFTTDTTVTVVFSEGVTAATANSAANYKINDGAIAVTAAVLRADGKTVDLTTAPIAKGSVNTLTVSGVQDTSNNPIAANSQIAVTFQRGALLVTADPGPLTFAGDNAVNQHMIDRGYFVELAQGALVPDDGSTAIGKDIVIQTSTLGSGTVEIPDPAGGVVNVSKFKFLTIPAVFWEASSIDAFGFTGETNGTTSAQTDLNIVDANHPLAAGLSAGLHTVVSSSQTFSQIGPPPLVPTGGHIIATIGTGTDAVICAYDTGERGFNNFAMPARRVFFFFQDNTAAAANADGWKLFDAAVDWGQNLTTVSTQPRFAPPTISSGSLQLSWTGSGTLQQTDSLTSPNWQTAASQANPQTVPVGTTGSRYYRIAP